MNLNIIAFCCNHCSYEAADRAGGLRKKYPESLRIVRVPCTGRVEPEFILRALEKGADGVLILGCHPGDCHYKEGNLTAFRRFILLRDVLQSVGIEDRIGLEWVGAGEVDIFVNVVDDFVKKIQEKQGKLKRDSDGFELRAKKALESL
ncbi:MAG TPA: hydrogenase iron-sulfur subunit [Archaeoglobaceae archaeon]|nr:hydrogenase iron-sulfur subunit [Archaeoglobaceae archaeon]